MKTFKDYFYDLLEDPTRENFRGFIENTFGEDNAIDFKETWISKDKLAKEMISIANYGGGTIIFGLKEDENNIIEPVGLDKLRDKAEISNDIKNLIPGDLNYEIHDLSYTTAEYEKLQNKNFQIIIIKDTPQYLPFMAKKDSGELKQNVIYIRRGTSCEQANKEEINKIINRKINATYPSVGKTLNLEEHLKQLNVLYKNIQEIHYLDFRGIRDLTNILKCPVENEHYPEESYDEFVSKMILEKKKKIERILDLK